MQMFKISCAGKEYANSREKLNKSETSVEGRWNLQKGKLS